MDISLRNTSLSLTLFTLLLSINLQDVEFKKSFDIYAIDREWQVKGWTKAALGSWLRLYVINRGTSASKHYFSHYFLTPIPLVQSIVRPS